jgi:hypothetical protein
MSGSHHHAADSRPKPKGRGLPRATIVDPKGGEVTVELAVPDGESGERGRRGAARIAGRLPTSGTEVPIAVTPAMRDAHRIDAPCPVCGCKFLYYQRDLNRTLGVSFVAIASIIGIVWSALQGTVWPLFWCLVGASLIDVTIYLALPSVVVCYRCLTSYRGLDAGEGVEEYDQAIADGFAYSDNVLGTGYEHQGGGA